MTQQPAPPAVPAPDPAPAAEVAESQRFEGPAAEVAEPQGVEAPAAEAAEASRGESPAAAGARSPTEILEGLRSLLLIAEAKAQTSGTVAKSAKADLALLEKAAQDIDKTVDGYDKARPGLAQQVADQSEYSTGKHTVIDAAIDDRKDDVDAAVTWFTERETSLLGEAEDADDDLASATANFTGRQADLTRAQEEWTAAKDRVRALTDGLKAVDQLRTALEKAQDEDDIVLMYATVVEFDRLLGEVQLTPADDFRDGLEKKWTALVEAQEALRTADAGRVAATFEVTRTRQTLAAFRAARIDQIVAHAAANPVPHAGARS